MAGGIQSPSHTGEGLEVAVAESVGGGLDVYYTGYCNTKLKPPTSCNMYYLVWWRQGILY